MRYKLNLYRRVAGLAATIGVMLLAFTSTAAVPSISWAAPEGAEWYQVQIAESGGFVVYDAWLQDTGDLCNNGTCTHDPSAALPLGLAAGDYGVTLNYWDANAGQITLIETQTLTVSNPDTTVNTPGGRLHLTIPDDPALAWVEVWAGSAGTFQQLPDLSGGWYDKAAMNCGSGTCTFTVDVHPSNGDYWAYLRYWNETDGISNWSSGYAFNIDEATPTAVTNMNTSLDEVNQATLTWAATSATWYRLWLGSPSGAVDTWLPALDLGCGNGGTCTYTSTTLNAGETYSWYVYSWGPGGFPTGGLSDSGWAQGPDIVVPDAGAPIITSGALPDGTIGVAYTHQFTAIGDDPITFTVNSGALPAGLTINGNTISGTPTESGTFTGRIRASNSFGNDNQNFTIDIGMGAADTFLMQNGLLVVDIESIPAPGDWTFFPDCTTCDGNTTPAGRGYYAWRDGNTSQSITQQHGVDTLAYSFFIPEAGRYRFISRGTSPDPGDAYNDVWMRVLGTGAGAVAIDPTPDDGNNNDFVDMGQDWFKSYNNRTEEWRWQASHVDNDAHEIFLDFPGPGVYSIEISGRSNQFRLDRFVIFDDTTVDQNDATDINNPESPRQ